MEEELEEKGRIIEELQEDLIKSATLGKGLLDRNYELEQQLKEQEDFYTEKIDDLEQENFVLRNKIETHERLVSEQFSDLEQMRSASQERDREHLELEKLQVTHTKTVARLEGKVSELIDELDGASRSYDTLKEKLERQELLLSEWKEKANNKSNTSYLEVEMGSLQSTVAKLERENDELLVKLQDEEAVIKALRSTEEKHKTRITAIQEEADERIEEISSLHTALQATKEKNMELTQEVQMLKMDSENSTKRKGNSLFSEVEDRRIETEKRFISLKVKHESLEKAHTLAQHQLRKLKVNMRAFLTEKGQSTVSANHTQRLERAVASYRTQVEELRMENSSLKKTASTTVTTFALPESQQSGKSVPKELADFLQCELERVKAENEALEEKVEKLQLEKMWDADKLRECEGNLHSVEHEAVKLCAEAAKYRQKLQESIQKWKEERMQRERLKAELRQARESSNEANLNQVEKHHRSSLCSASDQKTAPPSVNATSVSDGTPQSTSMSNMDTGMKGSNGDVSVEGRGNNVKSSVADPLSGEVESKVLLSLSSEEPQNKVSENHVKGHTTNCVSDDKENINSEVTLQEVEKERNSKLLAKAHESITVNSEEVINKCSQQ
jgi:chromosome segregation ATPase